MGPQVSAGSERCRSSEASNQHQPRNRHASGNACVSCGLRRRWGSRTAFRETHARSTEARARHNVQSASSKGGEAIAMPSPFPGMDPFLEVDLRWQDFHAWFMRELARLTLSKAQELGCWINVERTIYQREPSGELVLIGEPDQAVGVNVSSPAWSDASAGNGGIAVAEPKAIHEVVLDPDALERIKQDYLVVREVDQFARVLAVVEVLSPANKSG